MTYKTRLYPLNVCLILRNNQIIYLLPPSTVGISRCYELPCGSAKPNESPMDTAINVGLIQAGLHLNPQNLLFVHCMYLDNQINLYFEISKWNLSDQSPKETTIEAFSVDDLPNNLKPTTRFVLAQLQWSHYSQPVHIPIHISPPKPVRDKAHMYIVVGGHLLVIRHVGLSYERVGLQVPGGSVKPDESYEMAALREAQEETGRTDIKLLGSLGVVTYDNTPYLYQRQRRHVFYGTLTTQPPQRWPSAESNDGVGEPIPFECFWVPLADAHVLMAGQSLLVGRLTDELKQTAPHLLIEDKSLAS